MRAAILNPGPCLDLYPGRAGYDLVVGVNRAATRHPVDVWVATDPQPVRDHFHAVVSASTGVPPLLVTGVETWGTLDTDVPRYPGEIIDQARYIDAAPAEYSWTSFSGLSAIVYAASRGATEIDVYGADWRGTLDFDGAAAGENREPARWEWERSVFLNLLAPHFRTRGVILRRVVRPVFASFFTPIYAREAAGLVATLDRFGLPRDVRQIESHGSWVRNCARKAEYVREARVRHPGQPVVWLDADARVRREPVLFNRLDCDFAAHWREGHELLSGTCYFAPTPAADRLVDEWCRLCTVNPDVWDQLSLQAAVNATEGLRTSDLPPNYTQIFDTMAHEGEPIVEHMQASRRLREAVS
ncbi:MAG TPA: hypothetical protein VGE74_23330 [Gemmata sp.]